MKYLKALILPVLMAMLTLGVWAIMREGLKWDHGLPHNTIFWLNATGYTIAATVFASLLVINIWLIAHRFRPLTPREFFDVR
jgi:hypothetical protein